MASGPAALLRLGCLPLTLRCTWVPAGSTPSGQPATWLLTLRDPEANTLDAALLQAMLGLTPAAARVAALLGQGHDTAAITRKLGIQANTVGSHLKRALAKTATRRQGQLLALLLRSAALVPVAHTPSETRPHASVRGSGSPCHQVPCPSG